MKKSISCNCQFTQMKGNSNALSANLMELLPTRIPIHIMFVQVQMADDGWLHCQSLPVTATMVQLAVDKSNSPVGWAGTTILKCPNRSKSHTVYLPANITISKQL